MPKKKDPKEKVNKTEVNTKTPNAHDVAAYILQKCGPMTAMKLQKLVYYCQAWSLVWDESPLFNEPIEAWANGPVVPSLFSKLQGTYIVTRRILGKGAPSKLKE